MLPTVHVQRLDQMGPFHIRYKMGLDQMRLDKVGMHLIDHERSRYPSRGKRRLRSIFIFEHLCDSVLRECRTPTGYFKHMSTHHADGKVDSSVPGVGAPPQQVMSSTCLNIMRMWMITT